MAVEDRYLIDLSNINAIRFECKSCGAALSLRPREWTSVPLQCAACGTPWVGTDSEQFKTLNRLSIALRASLSNADAVPYRLRLEVERPK